MKIKTNELTGAALDWAVAECEGHKPVFTRHWVKPSHPEDPRRVCVPAPSWVKPFEPSANWSQGGPIIEREHIALDYYHTPIHPDVQPMWEARHGSGVFEYGPTPLIAAMRCYVDSKLGNEVEIPEELT